MVTDVIQEKEGVLEKASIDEYYLDHSSYLRKTSFAF